MTETDERPPEGRPHEQQEGAHEGPRVSGEEMRDLGRLRRSRTDRYLGGVAGGLARHFDVDPTVIRVLFVVTSFFGGAGVLAYAALWLVVPEEGTDRAALHLRGDARRTVVVVVAVIAVLVLLGNAWGGAWNGPWSGIWHLTWILLVVGVLAAVVTNRDRRRGSAGQPAPQQPAAYQQPAPGTATEAGTRPDTDSDVSAGPGEPTQPLPWQAPPPPVPPARPRRTGPVWFWPTLALIAIGLGILAVVGAHGDLAAGSYAALALTIIGAMLVLGAFVGRAGGLIALGILASLALVVSTAVGQVGFDFHNRTLTRTPTTAAQVASSYHVATGSIRLDLSQVRDVAALGGRTVEVSMNAGQIHVIVPDGVDVAVHADIDFAGDIDVAGQNHNGTNPVLDTVIDGGRNVPQLELDLHERVGQIVVDREGVLQ